MAGSTAGPQQKNMVTGEAIELFVRRGHQVRQRAGREGNAVIFARLLVGRTQKRDSDEATLPTLNQSFWLSIRRW